MCCKKLWIPLHNPKAGTSSWLEHCFLAATSSGFPLTPQSTELGAGTHRARVWGCLGTTRLTVLLVLQHLKQPHRLSEEVGQFLESLPSPHLAGGVGVTPLLIQKWDLF